MLHYYRNLFNGTKLVVSKKKSIKIKEKHPLQARYILELQFQELLNTTIGTCDYKQKGIVNFITYNDNVYLIYGISTNQYYNELSTLFKPSIRQLIKCQKSIKFFSKEEKVIYEKYIKN